MVKSYQQYVREAQIQRTGEISLPSLGGGIKEPLLSFETQRNPENTGTLTLELYTDKPQTYIYRPTEKIQALMSGVNAKGKTADPDKLEEIASMIRQEQKDLSIELLQLFTQLEADLREVLGRHGITQKEEEEND